MGFSLQKLKLGGVEVRKISGYDCGQIYIGYSGTGGWTMMGQNWILKMWEVLGELTSDGYNVYLSRSNLSIMNQSSYLGLLDSIFPQISPIAQIKEFRIIYECL